MKYIKEYAFWNKDSECDKYIVAGGYRVKVDNVLIDISFNQGRKIYNKARKIFNKAKKEEEEYIKKDARISL